jgi:hypothetical protein
VRTSGPFQLDAASLSGISSIPTNGLAFSLACDEKACGNSQVSALILDTTDALVTRGLPFFPFPLGSTVHVECIASGTSVTVPEKVSSLINQASPTRIRAEFFRGGLQVESDKVPVLAGYGYVGFTDP